MQNLNYTQTTHLHAHTQVTWALSHVWAPPDHESLHTAVEGGVTHTRGPGGLTPTTWVSPGLTEHPAPGPSPRPCQTPGMGASRRVQEATDLGCSLQPLLLSFSLKKISRNISSGRMKKKKKKLPLACTRLSRHRPRGGVPPSHRGTSPDYHGSHGPSHEAEETGLLSLLAPIHRPCQQRPLPHPP